MEVAVGECRGAQPLCRGGWGGAPPPPPTTPPVGGGGGRISSHDLERFLPALTVDVARAIDGVLAGGDLSVEDAVTLFDCTGADMQALVLAADYLRRDQA